MSGILSMKIAIQVRQIHARGKSMLEKMKSVTVQHRFKIDPQRIGQIRANPPAFMNEPEVAIFLGLCERSVRNGKAGSLRSQIFGGRILK